MPDKHLCNFIEIGMVRQVIDDMNNYARARTISSLCKILTYLATHKDCKAYILKYNGLERANELIMESSDLVKLAGIRLLKNLE
jgi:hypothetical protein